MKAKIQSKWLTKTWSKDKLYQRNEELLHSYNFTDNIERIHIDDITVEEFYERYEKAGKPVIIKGACDSWDAKTKWNFKDLIERFPDAKFKIGEKDDGNDMHLSLREYLEYYLYNRDDSPLYVFEPDL